MITTNIISNLIEYILLIGSTRLKLTHVLQKINNDKGIMI